MPTGDEEKRAGGCFRWLLMVAQSAPDAVSTE